MLLSSELDYLTKSLDEAERNQLQRGEVVLIGQEGTYATLCLVKASLEIVWQVLTAYEDFPQFLPSVVASRIRERQGDRIIVERKDRRKIGWMPIQVKIVTENLETFQDRIDYRMLEGTLDAMHGNWRMVPLSDRATTTTMLVQTITAKANMGPLQPYFYEVFEQGLLETMTDLRSEMERRAQLE